LCSFFAPSLFFPKLKAQHSELQVAFEEAKEESAQAVQTKVWQHSTSRHLGFLSFSRCNCTERRQARMRRRVQAMERSYEDQGKGKRFESTVGTTINRIFETATKKS